MDKEEMLETTNEAENVDTQTTEENVDTGIELTDTSTAETAAEKAEAKKLRDLLKDNPQYQEEFNDIMKRRVERVQREIESKYTPLANVVKAGLNTDSIEEATSTLANFYTQKGVKIPSNQFSDREEKILANAYADEIIADGYDEIVKEVDKLSQIGADKMTARQKLVLLRIASERQSIEEAKQLAEIGINTDDKDFKEFSNNLNPNMSIKQKYELYKKFNPKPEVEQIGSMKNNNVTKEPKSYYTPEEVDKLTTADLSDPKIMEAVDKSMATWYKNRIS